MDSHQYCLNMRLYLLRLTNAYDLYINVLFIFVINIIITRQVNQNVQLISN